MLLESRATRSYKYQILNFIGLDEFDLWLVKGLVIEENMFLEKALSYQQWCLLLCFCSILVLVDPR